ncbi:MAG: SMC family ATPase, partial [Fimbriiglobus sp.]|nr:SMC family ATPase [Fimbriiglobus sp.]
PVWMLAGTNGSGKSSIFDAVTYALFGHHRGGSQNAGELINKESTGLTVEFDFHLDGQLYRIKRTLRRSQKGAQSSTQQVFIRNAAGEWDAVPDTTKKTDFDHWVSEKIGLTYDIFTSSVLLLQGKAEKLLDSKPSGRFEVLAGIVDLDRYQRLHEKANTKKNELKSKLDTVSAQTEGVPEVTDEQFAQAIIAIDAAEQDRDRAKAKIDDAQDKLVQAGRWADAEGRAAAARQKLAQAESLLGHAVKIEKDFTRLTELKAVLPTVQTVVTVRNELRLSDERRATYEKRRKEENERRSQADTQKLRLQRQRDQDSRRLQENENLLSANLLRLRELEGQLQTVRMVDDETAKLERLKSEAKSLPADPDAELAKAREEEARILDLGRVLPILERVNTERHDLAQAIKQEAESRRKRDDTGQQGKDAKAVADGSRVDLDNARTARTTAEADAAVAKAEVDRATAALAEFATLNGAKSCRACGQPLTMAHFKEEKAKREQELKDAEAKRTKATAAAKEAADRERKLAEQEATQTKTLTDLRELYKDYDAALKQATADIERLIKSLTLRYAELPSAFASRISPARPTDWSATKYPERDELVTLRREVETIDAVRRGVKTAEANVKKFNDIRSRSQAAEENLRRLSGQLTDPADQVRREHATLQSQEKSLTATVKEQKLAIETLDREIDKAGREGHAAVTALAAIAKQLESEDEKQKIHTDNLTRSLALLPDEWRTRTADAGLKEHGTWKAELDELQSKNTEQLFRQLEQARIGLGAMRDEIAALEEAATAFPPEVRRPADEVKALVLLAKQEFEQKDHEVREREKERDKLDGYRQQRARLSEQYKQIDREHARHKVLSELLGRDRLQRHLVRQAERQIVDYANAVLDRLSGGQLFLKLVGTDDGDGNKALDLECFNRHTGGAPINVAFLSGSQKFRVAVSLALAIGQYASRQHRPIESVIIDEGFGCLDRQGRQVMIQELQNLRGHLHCILLVSHQEEFADAFADGYRFELQDGATKVSRFQR